MVLLLGKALDFSLRFGRAPAWATGCRFVQVTAEPVPTPEGVVAIVADLPILCSHVDLNGGSVPWLHADVAVAGLDAKLGFAIEVKGLIPFVGGGKKAQSKDGEDCEEGAGHSARPLLFPVVLESAP